MRTSAGATKRFSVRVTAINVAGSHKTHVKDREGEEGRGKSSKRIKSIFNLKTRSIKINLFLLMNQVWNKMSMPWARAKSNVPRHGTSSVESFTFTVLYKFCQSTKV